VSAKSEPADGPASRARVIRRRLLVLLPAAFAITIVTSGGAAAMGDAEAQQVAPLHRGIPAGVPFSPGFEVDEERAKPVRIAVGREADLRRFLRGEIQDAFPEIRVFGSYLDDLVASIDRLVRHARETEALPFQVAVPRYFFEDSLNLRMEVSVERKLLRIYADSLLVAEEKVALGDYWMDEKERERDFTTREGTYFINRVVREPWWYPPTWADRDRPVAPGPDNPLGAWMAELCKDSTRAGYGFTASRRATGMRLHGTHVELNDQLFPTHGCVRISQRTQDELCAAILRYSPHDSARVTSRGEIIPLRRPIRIDIAP
jgi:hypothetical protein